MGRREELTVGKLTLEGSSNAEGVKVIVDDTLGNAVICTGTAVPNAKAGYAKGCILIKTDAANGVKALYENKGTTASCSFDVIGNIGAAEITLADGKILIGGADGLAAAQTMSGDVTTTNAGVTSIGANKVKKGHITYATKTVSVAVGQVAGSSALDAALVNGVILGVYPAGNQDQLMDNIVLNGDGSITITLAAAATAQNDFTVVVLKA